MEDLIVNESVKEHFSIVFTLEVIIYYGNKKGKKKVDIRKEKI